MQHENHENLMRFINLDKALNSIYQRQAKKFEVSESTIEILYEIRLSDRGMTQKEIIEDCLLPKQTVNSAMKKLLDEGRVYVSEKQGREKRFLLTEKGMELAKETADLVIEAEKRAFFAFSEEEQETVISLLETYTGRLAEEMDKF